MKVLLGDLLGGGGDGAQGPQHPTGDQPPEPGRDHRHDRKRDSRPELELVEIRELLAVYHRTNHDTPGAGFEGSRDLGRDRDLPRS